MTVIRTCCAAVILFALIGQTSAADDRPPPPGDIFHYAISDVGDAIEIEWNVEDGAYMYRDAFGFKTATATIVLGEPELPEGNVHSDEFLGEQVIYRG